MFIIKKDSILIGGILLSISSLFGEVKYISPQDLQNLINDCKHYTNYLLLDVRDVNEVKNGIIASEYCKPYHFSFNNQELENNYTILPRDIPIYIYCRTGNRSKQAATFLINNGFTDVYSMEGGINAYKGKLYDSTEFKKWNSFGTLEPSFAMGNCTSVLECSNFVSRKLIAKDPLIIITVNKTISNGKVNFILSGKSIPKIKAIKMIVSYDPVFVLIKDAIVSIKIPELILNVSIDTIIHNVFFTIKGANNIAISDSSIIMELTVPIKNGRENKFNFIEAEIVDKNENIIKVNLYENNSVLPFINNNCSKIHGPTYSKILLNGRLSNVKNYKGIFVEINNKKGIKFRKLKFLPKNFVL